MRILGRVALAVLVIILLVIGVALYRTLTYKPPGEVAGNDVRLAPAVPVDVVLAAQHLSQAVQIQTVSHQDLADDQPDEWRKLHDFLAATYPAAHAAMTREIVGKNTLVYTWKGSDPSLAPIILMAHQDVVPVTAGSEGDWKHPPFSGAIADGAVWGRGSIDDKGNLITLFEGAEALAKQGFRPRRTVIIVSGEDEETHGTGAQAAAGLLKSRGIKAQFVVDEGLPVIADNPVTGGRLALIGTAEKGYATMAVTAKAEGGHSSAPPADGGGVVTLARAITAITDHGFPMDFRGPGAAMLQTIAGKAPFAVRMAVANPWLFKPLLIKQMGATPSGAAMLHTTIAPTMLKGSPKENVLPQDATAWINYRIEPGDTSASVMARARAAVAKLPVTLAWVDRPSEPSPVSSTASPGWKVLSAVASQVTGAPVAPSLVTAGTDSRYLQPVATNVYRFQAMDLGLKDVEMIHGTNEHLTLTNLKQCVQFYARLIATAAG
ncbi:MAG TPA: M20 family peptidase [Phenylobacterium sp.]|uniref:M20 family peptidase n=1 Tax=Phenylobacterium sp. TaxID=1871053 RepID=UPI002D3607E5|nr:M20 family peptidase [Phenylobacterium sp.]HZZ69037.1 M20 family peptidase [Phenylobacterium sp.]